MPLTPGTKLGPYEIVSPLGAGGMGEVYRARDTRLGREVAIKVLPQHLSAQPEIRARFEREAKTVSALNHPHICTLFDVGREGEIDYLVMELVEGDTLAERLKRGPLPAQELLRTGMQVADALDRAHRAGVTHRDLKPGNIMLTRSGAKLMDFGLARAIAAPAGGAGGSLTMATLTHSPPTAQPLTAEGTIVGTFQYMSPEQLEGRDADARSDLWSFGCVLYEMATGRRAFEGRSQASLIAAILEREPAPITDVPSTSSSVAIGGPLHGIDRLIRNCLAKDPDERIQTAHDVKLHLQGIAEGAGLSVTSVAPAPAVPPPATRASGRALWIAWGVAAAGVLVAAGAVAWLYPRAHAPAQPVRFRIAPVARSTDTYWPRLSPDGRYVLLVASDSTATPRAYIRPLDQIDAHPIAGTEGLRRAYWSPDSREFVFVTNDKMQRMSIAGGSPVIVCAAPGGADLSWGSKGLILMDGQPTDSLRVVPAGGGELRPAARIDRKANEVGSAWPCFLPDGTHFLFIGNLGGAGFGGNIRLGKIGSLESKVLGQSDGRVEYAPGGWVLFVRGTTLLAQKLDLGAGKLTGQPITITDNLRVGSASGHFSTSLTGLMVFARQDGGQARTILLANRSGEPSGEPLATGTVARPRPSPDGHKLLYEIAGQGGRGDDIHVVDLDRATDTRLTFAEGASSGEWSPDGHRFAYVTNPGTASAMVRIVSADGMGGQDSIPLPPGMTSAISQWASAGSRLVLSTSAGECVFVSADGSPRSPETVAGVPAGAHQKISPDGRWLAYVTGQLPSFQIFVQSLQGPAGRWQISTSQAMNPFWTRGGREIVYEGWDGRVMAVDIDTASGFHAGTPHPLFRLPARSFDVNLSSWAPDSSGDRFFLVSPPPVAQGAGTIELTTSFRSLVNRR